MKPETRQKIITLYWNWCRRGRDDWGLPYSLGDYLYQMKRDREKRAKGEPCLSLEEHAEAVGLPLTFLQELDAAMDEGITDDEIKELGTIQAKRKEPNRERS